MDQPSLKLWRASCRFTQISDRGGTRMKRGSAAPRPSAGRDRVLAIRRSRSPQPSLIKDENAPLASGTPSRRAGIQLRRAQQQMAVSHRLRRTGSAPSPSGAPRPLMLMRMPASPDRYRAVLNSCPLRGHFICVHLRLKVSPCRVAITRANETRQQPEDDRTALTCHLVVLRISRP
jgi:hypothetical protein